eukprot:scaffold570_cov382-Prasinococcus_capsulatus_cf.AAC.1
MLVSDVELLLQRLCVTVLVRDALARVVAGSAGPAAAEQSIETLPDDDSSTIGSSDEQLLSLPSARALLRFDDATRQLLEAHECLNLPSAEQAYERLLSQQQRRGEEDLQLQLSEHCGDPDGEASSANIASSEAALTEDPHIRQESSEPERIEGEAEVPLAPPDVDTCDLPIGPLSVSALIDFCRSRQRKDSVVRKQKDTDTGSRHSPTHAASAFNSSRLEECLRPHVSRLEREKQQAEMMGRARPHSSHGRLQTTTSREVLRDFGGGLDSIGTRKPTQLERAQQQAQRENKPRKGNAYAYPTSEVRRAHYVGAWKPSFAHCGVLCSCLKIDGPVNSGLWLHPR